MLTDLLYCLAEMLNEMDLYIHPKDESYADFIDIKRGGNTVGYIVMQQDYIAIHSYTSACGSLLRLTWGDFADPNYNPEETLQAIAAKAREL